MKAFIGFIALLAAVPAAAQDASSAAANGTVNGNAQAANNVTVVADAGRYAPADTSLRQSGHVYSTPAVAGSFFSGANPCLVGTGVGAAGGPIGFNINLGKSDKGCQRRADAGAWFSMGFQNVAIARMCSDLASADAFFAATGEVCPGATDPTRYKLADGSPAPIAYVPGPRPAPKP